jgi:hypothetical protein
LNSRYLKKTQGTLEGTLSSRYLEWSEMYLELKVP